MVGSVALSVRVTTVVAAIACLLAGFSTRANAQPLPGEGGPPPGTFAITGQVVHPTTVTLDDLRARPAETVSVTFSTHSGTESHTYTGTPLEGLISAAEPIADPAGRHPLLGVAVLAVDAEGYSAALAWAEIATAPDDLPPPVAYIEDGIGMNQPRLVVPRDREGARYVRNVTEFRVFNLAMQ